MPLRDSDPMVCQLRGNSSRSIGAAAFAAGLFSLIGDIANSADLPIRRKRPCNCPPPPKPDSCEQIASRLSPVPNTIEGTVINTIGKRDECFLPKKTPIILSVGEVVPINVRIVFNDGLFIPQNGKEIKLAIIDSFGKDNPFRYLNTEQIRSKVDGYSDQNVTFRSLDAGVYRIKAIYKDRDNEAFVLSPNIVVVKNLN